MRFFLVVSIWIVFIGGLWLYVWKRDASIVASTDVIRVEAVDDRAYSVELTPTFSAEADPFALDDGASSQAIELQLNGNTIDLSGFEFSRGQNVTIEKLSEVLMGHNELFLKASPPVSDVSINHGVRIRFLEDDSALLDETIWNNQGSLISGTINFKIESESEAAHDH